MVEGTQRALGLKTLLPTRKWWASTVVAVGGLLSTLALTGWDFTPEFNGALITIATQRIVTYLTPNEDTLGGVPLKR